VRQLLSDGLNIRYVDGGGGLGITYHANSNETLRTSIDSYSKALLQQLKGTDLHLLLEPGRSIIAPAGALVAKALYAKQNGRKRFLIVDAAMNDLLRPSLYGAYHEIVAVDSSEQKSDGESDGLEAGTADVVGPICETGDFFARDREMPSINPGELVAILDAGAYGMSLSSNYNTRPRAAEILVEGKKAKLIRRRESVADLLKFEQ
jgi:diaminopimelate decarboxylase